MRHKRAKQNRRTLQHYERVSGIRAPYHIILDGPFLVATQKFKMDTAARLVSLLSNAPIKLCALPSTINELKKLHEASSNDIVLKALTWCKKNCMILTGEEPPPTNTTSTTTTDETDLSIAAQALLRYVTKDPRYFVASQDTDLLRMLRRHNTPILRLSRTVLLLEAPNTTRAPTLASQSQLSTAERELVGMVERHAQSDASEAQQRRIHHKAKGPNPLSCKKRKQENSATSKKKRSRRKKGSKNDQDGEQPFREDTNE